MESFPIFIALVISLLCSNASAYSFHDAKVWCAKTPNPQPCEYSLTSKPSPAGATIKGNSDLLKIMTRNALDGACTARIAASSLGPKCKTSHEIAAWSDCLQLFQDTISKLNETLNPTKKCTQTDVQTWLSTALSNLETCKDGFRDLGVINNSTVLPYMMSNNVSKMISNSLAVNYVPHSEPRYNHDGFPRWVRPGDRKLLQTPSSPASQGNIVVAKDGSGSYTTLKAAIDAASKRSGSRRFVIYVKAGTYSENVVIKLRNIMLVGDGIGKTIITGSRSVGGGSTTFDSATVAVTGGGFIARDITFRNTAGPGNHQAVALRSGSDLSVFYRCGFEGYQDTLYVHSQRQFYRECDIYGTVDFIFGNAAVVLQNCNIYARRPPKRTNTLTAQGRTDPNQNTGISIHNSRVTAASDLRPVQSSVRTYLGRPWKQYSRTVFMKTFLDGLIDPAGWMPWSGSFALNTLYYGEYMNSGAGSSTGRRVNWRGYRVISSASEASRFTVENMIAGNSWLPATNVPFTSGL